MTAFTSRQVSRGARHNSLLNCEARTRDLFPEDVAWLPHDPVDEMESHEYPIVPAKSEKTVIE
jgi:hypothetical protein